MAVTVISLADFVSAVYSIIVGVPVIRVVCMTRESVTISELNFL